MCDYCGCRSEPPLAELGREHADILWHLSVLGRALDKPDLAEARHELAHIVDHLVPHIEKEERGVFAQLRIEGELTEEIDSLSGEHEGLRKMAAELPEDDMAWRAGVTELVRTLREHIQTEEYDLFPAAWQMLSNDGWMAVREVHDAANQQSHHH
jgi:hemerythrin-like domain-containing protein